jgi:flagellar hook protein FlgE
MSFYTSLSGLQASQKEMSTISHNLANVATDGFKKSRVEFADVIASSVTTNPNSQVGSGVVTKSIRQQFGQGNLVQTGGALDLVISGDGFFTTKPDSAGTAVTFTRAGSFQVDQSNFVTDTSGNFLQAYPVDPAGNVAEANGGKLISLRVPETSGDPKATSKVSLDVTLNAGASVISAPFDRNAAGTYNRSTQTTVYDANGNAHTLTNYYVRTKAPTAGDDTSSWQVYSFVGNQQLTPESVELTFNNNGTMTSSGQVTFDAFTPAGSVNEQTLSLDLTGTAQRATAFALNSSTQDGATVGNFTSLAVDSNGVVRASFSNGDTQALGKLAIANFSNPSGLRQLGDSAWSATGVSGAPVMGEANKDGFGGLMTGIIEGSNVDITEELVALIAAQRNFQANAKALDTSSQISQTIFNIRG